MSRKMCQPPPLLIREFAHAATVIAASHSRHVVLTGSCALNLYLPPAYAIDTQDIDLFLHYLSDGDDSTSHRDALLQELLDDMSRQFHGIAARFKYTTTVMKLHVGNLWHSGAMTYQLSYGGVHFADITAVPYHRLDLLCHTFPRTSAEVKLPNDDTAPVLYIAVASLEELLHRIVCTLTCKRTLDGFNGISAATNAWRIAKDAKRLQRVYELFNARQLCIAPQRWNMEATTPYRHSVPIDTATLLPVFGKSTFSAVHDAFNVSFAAMMNMFGNMNDRLNGQASRVGACVRNVVFMTKHAASKERSRKRLDDSITRTRARLKTVNNDAKRMCKNASETIDALRMMVLMAQKDAERCYGTLVTSVETAHSTLLAAVQCTGTDITLTSFAANFTSISTAVADAKLMPFCLFSHRTCGFPAPIPIDTHAGLATLNAQAASGEHHTHADALRQLFARSLVATFVVILEMLSRSRMPRPLPLKPTPSVDAVVDVGVIEPGWKDTGDMLSTLARHVRSLSLSSKQRVVPLISKSGQLSIRVLEEAEVEANFSVREKAETGIGNWNKADVDMLVLPLADNEKDVVFAMCDSFITVLTTPLLAHACAIGSAVRTSAAAVQGVREALANVKKPSSSSMYQKLTATSSVAQQLRKIASEGFVQ